jgi:molecular chaperone GrpE (heat shock protein)
MSEHVSNAQIRDTDSDETWSEAELGDPPDISESPAGSPSLQTLADAVESLRAALTASQRAQEHQQALLDKLHDEKEQLREAEQRRQRDPVLRDLIQLSDTCLRTSRQWRERADVSQETAQTVAAVLGDAAEDVHLILERQGIEDFAPMAGDKFLRSESKAVGTQPTADEALDGMVAAVRKPGYRLGGRVLRFSEVVVWRLERSDADGEVPPQM